MLDVDLDSVKCFLAETARLVDDGQTHSLRRASETFLSYVAPLRSRQEFVQAATTLPNASRPRDPIATTSNPSVPVASYTQDSTATTTNPSMHSQSVVSYIEEDPDGAFDPAHASNLQKVRQMSGHSYRTLNSYVRRIEVMLLNSM
jgi:hypothetical protein